MRVVLAATFLVAGLSMFVVAPAPGYDPTSWLIWGRELTQGELSTVDGPAFKPLPVLICAALAPFGPAAPWLWVLVARAAALAAVPLAFALAWRLSGRSVAAGVLAAGAVVLCEGALALDAAGLTEGALVTLALAGIEAFRRERDGLLLACALAAALLRVEAWPVLAGVLILVWRRGTIDRRLAIGSLAAVPAAWFVPELLGSGDLLRSGARARIVEPGQPGLAQVPFAASLREAIELVPWPLVGAAGLLAIGAGRDRAPAARRALAPGLLGLGWLVLVAAMAQAGFSGESRYALPGAMLIALSGASAIGLALRRLARPAAAAGGLIAVALVGLATVPALEAAGRLPAQQAYAHDLRAGLRDAIEAAGGRGRVLACGVPHVGQLRGPMLAYALDVPRHLVEPDEPARPPATVFRSALREGDPVTPLAPAGFPRVAATPKWEVLAACGAPVDSTY